MEPDFDGLVPFAASKTGTPLRDSRLTDQFLDTWRHGNRLRYTLKEARIHGGLKPDRPAKSWFVTLSAAE
ncbi:MAG: hypothetical protein AAGG44_11045 [Planctomycetota bacterium]